MNSELVAWIEAENAFAWAMTEWDWDERTFSHYRNKWLNEFGAWANVVKTAELADAARERMKRALENANSAKVAYEQAVKAAR